MIQDFIRLVYLSLKTRRLRNWLTMVGIFIGIAAVVSLIGLGEGLRETIAGQFDFLSTDILTIQASGLQAGPPGTGVVAPLTKDMVEDLERITGVELVIGRLIESAKLTFEGRSDFTFAASMPEDKKSKELQRIVQLEIAEGRIITSNDVSKIVLGYNYAKGDRFSRPIRQRDKVLVADKEFEVVGLLKKKGSFIIDNTILMEEETMRELYDVPEKYGLILVKANKGVSLERLQERIEKYLRKERNVDEGEEDFTVESPEANIATLNSTLFAVQLFVYIIAAISIIIGGIGIMNTMYTSVLERTKEIGIMKSIGATNGSVFTLFFLESGFLGAIGGLIGILLGAGLAHGLAAIGRLALGTSLLSVSLSPFLLVGALLFSFVIGTVAGILPAHQASKLHPIDALQQTK